jgi:hypothetical protein
MQPKPAASVAPPMATAARLSSVSIPKRATSATIITSSCGVVLGGYVRRAAQARAPHFRGGGWDPDREAQDGDRLPRRRAARNLPPAPRHQSTSGAKTSVNLRRGSVFEGVSESAGRRRRSQRRCPREGLRGQRVWPRRATCPVSTGGGTRRVQSVRKGGGGRGGQGDPAPVCHSARAACTRGGGETCSR